MEIIATTPLGNSLPWYLKQKSEALLAKHGILCNPSLPPIEAQINIRTTEEITGRILALCYCALKGEGANYSQLEKYSERFNVREKLTPKEKVFARKSLPSEQEKIDACWGYESAWILLWALKLAEKTIFPSHPCNAADVVRIIASHSETSLSAVASRRNEQEILFEADFIYRCHWVCKNNTLNNVPLSPLLDPSVTYEWHYAINWLIGYEYCDWDDIRTNT
ncbi:DUF4272 domain-containing protein [Nostoc sp. PCC 7107]|uniref:DUF4272 domain-containing protein n=1 Tax=Nostoc sp. PCC 7107 TaxID=317936 RepID=UPI00029ECC0F|nr:DUF4272 domain-containing protein [Nostoc sp. PCC 7107]AFY43817.1 hypothetical protein Nos7107_3229 [Nostoc sp. PCC 7107]